MRKNAICRKHEKKTSYTNVADIGQSDKQIIKIPLNAVNAKYTKKSAQSNLQYMK